ncbi:MAG: tryptophan synthase subunit alpha [Thermoproteota archaeon]
MRGIQKTFSSLKSKREGGLIAYVTAGDPHPSYTPRIVEALLQGGADIIELGIPFSDPIADGPTIQSATLRALKSGTTPRKTLNIAEKIREKTDAPLVLLTYYNPIFKMGVDTFFNSAQDSGVDGVIVPDLPIEEAEEYKEVAHNHEIDTIFLAAPSTPTSRLRKIIEYTSGFLYLVSLFGVTGARKKIQTRTIELIEKTVPIINQDIPLAVGFGISRLEHVKAVIQAGADAAIVGSGFVRIIEREHRKEEQMLEDLREYAHQLKTGTMRE